MQIECEDCKGVFRNKKTFDRHACTRIVTDASSDLRSKIDSKREKEKLLDTRIAELRMKNALRRRGEKLSATGACNYCSRKDVIVWQYKSTSGSFIKLCLKCRAQLLRRASTNRSKVKNQNRKSEDALDKAQFGGGFETNRRRH